MESGGENLAFVAEIFGSVVGTSVVPNYGDNWMIALTAVNTQNLVDIHLVTLHLAAVISSKMKLIGNEIEVRSGLGPWDVA